MGDRLVGVMSAVPGVCNELGGREEEGSGPESRSAVSGVGMGMRGWLILSKLYCKLE